MATVETSSQKLVIPAEIRLPGGKVEETVSEVGNDRRNIQQLADQHTHEAQVLIGQSKMHVIQQEVSAPRLRGNPRGN